jgi:nucleoside-diphosphate kinase
MAVNPFVLLAMPAERSFVAIKPDGVQRGLVGEIIGRFERKGFKLVGLKQLTPSRELAESHYGVHSERPFFAGLVEFITSGPVVAMVWEGDGVIASARKLIGATKPLEAEPGTIRGDLAINIGRNVIHGSDAPETAAFEIGLWFQPSELSDWTPADQGWRVEG